MSRQRPSEGLYICRKVTNRDKQVYFDNLRFQMTESMGNPDSFKFRYPLAVTLLGGSAINLARKSGLFWRQDPDEVRSRLIGSLPNSKRSSTYAEVTEIRTLDDGDRPVLAAMVEGETLEKEHSALLDTLDQLSEIDITGERAGSLHITIGTFTRRVERAAVTAAEKNILGTTIGLRPIK